MLDPIDTPAITTLGRYEILGRIAAGGMATVYLGRLGAAGGFTREFAIKVVHPHLSDNEDFCGRFLEEARLASRVRHPNAVRTIDAGEASGYRFLVLELIDGVNLRQLMLLRNRPLSPVQAASVVAQVARGLQAVHSATDEHGRPLGMVHRDMSPHNVMIDREGRAIVIDLGLAKAEERELTQVGTMCGKLPYMSPEQARMESLDASSDIFSLGTLLFELCTGELPFGEDHNLATLTALQNCDGQAVARALARHDVPAWLVEVILVCLQPRPQDRFPSARAVAEALSDELHRQGFDEARIRSNLATLVAGSMQEIGTTEALDTSVVLPPRIGPLDDRTTRILNHYPLRWGVAGVLIVGLLAFGFGQWTGPRGLLERKFDPHGGGTLASDQAPAAETTSSLVPAPTPRPKASPAPSLPMSVSHPALDESAADTDTPPPASTSSSKPSTRARKSRGRTPPPQPRPSRLKSNPYVEP